jgi:cytochrome c551/c552
VLKRIYSAIPNPRIITIPVLLFLVIQLFPVRLLQTNPPVVKEPQWLDPQTRVLAQRACFDCHSNETVWPIYSRIAPVSWLVTNDMINGRSKLNFSDWGKARGKGGEASQGGKDENDFAKVINDGSMPPWYFLLLHPEAKLSEAEKQQLIQGMSALPK